MRIFRAFGDVVQQPSWRLGSSMPCPNNGSRRRRRISAFPMSCSPRTGSIREPILTHPPLLAIEVQSPEIPLRRTDSKRSEYLAFGIEHVWVIDPYARVAYRGTPNGLELFRDRRIECSRNPDPCLHAGTLRGIGPGVVKGDQGSMPPKDFIAKASALVDMQSMEL